LRSKNKNLDQTNRKGGNQKQKFEELFLSNYTSLFALGYQMCKDRELTKDVIQLLFADLWEKRDRLGKVDHWNAYLRKSFYRKMLAELKKQKRNYDITDQFAEPSVPSYEELLINLQSQITQQRQLHDALENLPEQQRKMLQARFIQGMSYNEIAEETGKSKQTVYNQIFTAVKKLRNLLGSVSIILTQI